MMGIGCIVRADCGGLATLTAEVVRHVRPDRVLIVDLGENYRGCEARPEIYEADWCETFITKYKAMGHEVERFLDGLATVYSAETFYSDRIYSIARSRNVATVLHVMPELFSSNSRAADVLWNPTNWRQEFLPERTEIVPIPVALDVLPYRQRTEARTFFMTAGEAMIDRNGSQIVMEATGHMRESCTLLYRGGPPPQEREWKTGTVTARWLPPVDRYEDLIPEEADILVMPRRYGGLTLPVQEAAARGIPSIMTNLSPQDQWMNRELLISTYVEHPNVLMKGGTMPVYGANPQELAKVMDRLVVDSDRVTVASDAARTWAETRSWDKLLPNWMNRLNMAQVRH